MTGQPSYRIIDGIKCFHSETADNYANYPDSGFDLTDQYVETSFWVRSRNRLFKRLIHKYSTNTSKTRYLDIGCGTGDFIRQLDDLDNLEIIGSEVYLRGLYYAKKNLPQIEFVQFDVARGTMDEEFDLIGAFDVIEHIEDDIVALKNMQRMLTDGGVLLISVPQYMFMWGRLDEIVRHKRRYSRLDLLSKLEDAGFDITFCTSFVFVLFPAMILSRFLDKKSKLDQADSEELKKRVRFPGPLNWLFDVLMRIDEELIGLGLSLPFGGTLVVVASKSACSQKSVV